MNKKIIIYAIIVLVVISGVFYFFRLYQKSSTQKSQEQTPTVQTPAESSGIAPITVVPSEIASEVISAKTYNISVINFSFNPATLSINKGDTVIWTNNDSVSHQIAGEGFNGPIMGKNQNYTFVFKNTGVFNYHCAIHPSMRGTITVK